MPMATKEMLEKLGGGDKSKVSIDLDDVELTEKELKEKLQQKQAEMYQKKGEQLIDIPIGPSSLKKTGGKS